MDWCIMCHIQLRQIESSGNSTCHTLDHWMLTGCTKKKKKKNVNVHVHVVALKGNSRTHNHKESIPLIQD